MLDVTGQKFLLNSCSYAAVQPWFVWGHYGVMSPKPANWLQICSLSGCYSRARAIRAGTVLKCTELFLLFWLPITEQWRVLNLTITNCTNWHAFDLCGPSVGYATILSWPILPVHVQNFDRWSVHASSALLVWISKHRILHCIHDVLPFAIWDSVGAQLSELIVKIGE